MSALRSPLFLPAAGLFALLAVVYTASIGLPASRSANITGDEPFYLLTTQSLLEDGNFDLREQYERESYREFFDHPDGLWRQSRAEAGERIMSPHEPGLSVLLLPGFAIGGLPGAQVELLLIAAATFALAFVLAAKETGRVRTAWLITAAVGLSAQAFVYSTEIYPEIPAAFLVAASVLVVRTKPNATRAVGLAALLTALAWLGMKYVPLAVVLGLWFALGASNRERAWFGAAAGVGAVTYIWGHLALFGALTPYAGNSVYDGASTAAVVDSHFSFSDRAYRLWGLFVDRRFGIGHWAPLLLLVLPALALLRGRTGALVAALFGTQVLVATFFAVTMMGWWFPGRQLIVVFPLMPLALTAMVSALPARLAPVWVTLGAWTLAVTAALAVAGHRGEVRVAVDPFELDAPIFAWTNPVFPDYRVWSVETQVLNLVWVAVLVGATVVVAIRTDGWRSLSVRARALTPRPPPTPLLPFSRGREGVASPKVNLDG